MPESLATMRRKVKQSWEMAGLARQDGDLVEEKMHIEAAKEWSAKISKHIAELKEDLPELSLYLEAQKLVIAELMGKIQLLVDWADSKGLLEDHVFTFPDGDTWKSADSEKKDS